MGNNKSKKFELDPFLERLLKLRSTDPAQFNAYPDEVKRLVEIYEQEKQAAQNESNNE